MNILLVSQCTKRALTETRRILDQFAERRGDRTWQTPITQQGMDTLRMLLRKTARKNTAVACHWIRGQNNSELLWVVGDAKKFNAHGATPTNMTERNILRQDDENDWHTAHDIRLLAAMAALFHDFGKANDTFQNKLKSNGKITDPYRHEWVSLRLFQAFVGQDADSVWLKKLADGANEVNPQWFANVVKDGIDTSAPPPLESMSPLAQAIGWLIVSHHRLPTPDLKPRDLVGMQDRRLANLAATLGASWCGSRPQAHEGDDPKVHQKALAACWAFAAQLPHHSAAWRKRAATLAQRMLGRTGLLDQKWFKDNPYAMHMARLTLILADHLFSSIEGDRKLCDPTYKAYANTDRKKAGSPLKQRLDEHLIGVEKGAHSIARSLPQLDASLPRIHNHRAFKQRSGSARFAWQDKAFDLATALQVSSEKQGFFGVNMASTGCGKTLANARIMYALAHPQKGARFTVALGLRTLTLQTGDALRERMGLGSDELAVMVGGGAVRELHEHNKKQSAAENATEKTLERAGSESAHDLLPSNTHVQYENTLHPGPLSEYLGGNDPQKQAAQQLLHAPVLVCTVDHLMPACEATRGGHHIVPMLRLLTSDLVLDEPDDFGIEDLYALTRLVHWAGLLGSRVLLSSATLPPALIQGLFAAYLAGRQSFQQNRGQPGLAASVCCAWFDENGAAHSEHAEEKSYLQSHTAFVQKRVAHLAAQHRTDQRRQAQIAPVTIQATSTPQIRREYAQVILKAALDLHRHPQNHTAEQTPAGQPSGKRVSFGLVRMANIDPLIDVVMALHDMPMPESVLIHLCVYHSRHPLLVRSGLEHTIDQALQRHGQDKDPTAQLRKPAIRAAIDAHPETDHLFVVLATAVAEVGRDHDYDWAVVEPSSNRLKTKDMDPAKLDAEIEKPNLQTVDVATLPPEADTLQARFTVRVLSGAGVPSACNSAAYQQKLKTVVDSYASTAGFATLAQRYASNLANGRFLWRNRVGAEMVEVQVRHLQDGHAVNTWTFNALNFSMRHFDAPAASTSDVAALAKVIEQGLSGQQYALLEVTAFARVGAGQEVFPSQELILDKGSSTAGQKSKTLYVVGKTAKHEGAAAIHSQKLGNAIRTVDTWYPDEGGLGPIAVEPYGSVTSQGKAYRQPKEKQDFYTLLDGWVIKDQVPAVDQQHYVMANLIRGGVFGESGKD